MKIQNQVNEVTIKSYDKSYDKQLLRLSVSENQLPYVGTLKEILEGKEEGFNYNIIFLNDVPVGFFLIDEKYGERYEFAKKDILGFRAFLIDENYQGKGIARATMQQLKSYLNSQFSDKQTILLTVNCKNEVAYHLYVKHGFEDDGELYYGGKAGPQHILKMDL